jgi:hypothetical protein
MTATCLEHVKAACPRSTNFCAVALAVQLAGLGLWFAMACCRPPFVGHGLSTDHVHGGADARSGLAWWAGVVVDAVLVELERSVADGVDAGGVDQFVLDSVVVVAVEFVLVPPGVRELECPAHVEIDEVVRHEWCSPGTVDLAGQ